MDVFPFVDYRAYIQARIDDARPRRGYQAKMADHLGIQRSFLTQVLRGSAQLSPDHAVELARFWEMDEAETAFFLDLVLLARAGSATLRKVLTARLSDSAKVHGGLSPKLVESSAAAKPGAGVPYYLAWYWSAIHVALSVPQLQTAAALSRRLGLSLDLVQDCLATLRELGLAKKTGHQWQILTPDLHIQRESPLSHAHHSNWRAKAIQDLQERGDQGRFHYTAVKTVTRADADRIKQLFVSCCESSRQIARESSPETELVCVTCDVFPV
jgi:uncharacterized protein (TIGR02147 family)